MSSKYGLSSPSLLPSNYRQIRWSGDSIPCNNLIYGCHVKVDSLEELQKHSQVCEHEPNSLIECSECLSQLKRSDLKYHNCIQQIKSMIKDLQQLMSQLDEKVNQQSVQLNQFKKQLNKLQLTQSHLYSDSTDGSTDRGVEEAVNLVNNSIYDSNVRKSQFSKTKGESEVSITSNTKVKNLPKLYSSYQISNKNDFDDENVEFGMYGSQKYKYLSQLSRDMNNWPLTPINSKQSIESELKKKNKQKLVNVMKQTDYINRPPVVRLRSWSARDNDF